VDDKLSKNECRDDLPYCTYTCTLYRKMKKEDPADTTDIEITLGQELEAVGGYRRYPQRDLVKSLDKTIEKGYSELIKITPQVLKLAHATLLASSLTILSLSSIALQ